MDVRVFPLAERPDLVSTVASWIFAEWGEDWPEGTPEAVAADVWPYCRPDGPPLALVAFSGDECCGTASLRTYNTGFPEALTPWLVRVYVTPRHRGRGVASRLVRAAEEVARGWGARDLYLCTTGRESFYERLGWTISREDVHHEKPVTVMHRNLAGTGRSSTLHRRNAMPRTSTAAFLLGATLSLAACGTEEIDPGTVTESADSAAPGMVTGTTGAPGPGTAGTPGTPAAPRPDTIGESPAPPPPR